MKVVQSCPTICDLLDHTVHGILQARILEWVAVPFSRASSWPRDWTPVSWIGRWILYHRVISRNLVDAKDDCRWGRTEEISTFSYALFRMSNWIPEKAMATHSSTLAWQIPWTEEPGGLQSTGSLGVGHDWATLLSLFLFSSIGFPGGSDGKASAYNAGDPYLIPGLGRSSGEGLTRLSDFTFTLIVPDVQSS